MFICTGSNTGIKPWEEPGTEKHQLSPQLTEQFINENYSEIETNDLIITQKKKVLIISCYGYGNMGDNMYAEVFGKYLADCEIVKISDHSVFVNSNLEFVDNPPPNDYKFDFLIIGGGGLITAKKLKDSRNMPHYINIAKKHNKPLFIVSCGVQGSIGNFKHDFSLWKDVLNYAKLVTVRSNKDKQLLSSISGVNTDKIMYFRDLGYIFPHTIRPYKNNHKTITLIVAGPVHDKNEIIKKAINDGNKNVVIMNMGSIKDDENNKRMIKMNFKDANIVKYYGSGRAPEFTKYESFMATQEEMEELLKRNPNLEKVNPSDLTLTKVINVLYNSEIVFTGRYHGFIFSRSMGIKYDTLGMDTNKVLWEEPIKNGKEGIKEAVFNSYNNIKMLRKLMKLPDTSNIDLFNLNSSIDSL